MLKEGSDIKKPPAYIGYSGIAQIESDEITVNVTDAVGVSMTFNKSCQIVFDNTCNQDPLDDNGDLAMLYRYVIEDQRVPDRQFTLERDPNDAPKETSSRTVVKILDNPPPGLPGLPCNIFVASDPDGLA